MGLASLTYYLLGAELLPNIFLAISIFASLAYAPIDFEFLLLQWLSHLTECVVGLQDFVQVIL